MPELRPMHEEDVAAVYELDVATFEDLDRRLGHPVEAPPALDVIRPRYLHPVRTDPGGAWVAEHEGEIVACALALRREGVWGLSLLIVHPAHQSSGLGRTMLARASEYAEGARGRIILASQDARALRAYSRLGLHAHPCLYATGVPQGFQTPEGVRAGSRDDIPFTEAVDRHVRGAAHGPDVEAWLEMNQTLLIAEDRGYAVIGEDGSLRVVAAFDDAGARAILHGAFAHAGGSEVTVSWITAAQQWAVRACLDARLELRTNAGVVFIGGDVGPFTPYLPSGAFL